MSSPKYAIIFHLKHEHTLHYDYATVRKDGAVSFFTPVRDGMLFETKQDACLWLKKHGGVGIKRKNKTRHIQSGTH